MGGQLAQLQSSVDPSVAVAVGAVNCQVAHACPTAAASLHHAVVYFAAADAAAAVELDRGSLPFLDADDCPAAATVGRCCCYGSSS